jgi:CBS domain-containing protein
VPSVKDVLAARQAELVTVSPGDTVWDAVRKMDDAGVGCIVIESGRTVLGVFTERDLLRRVVARRKPLQATPVSTVMSAPAKTCDLHDDLRDVAAVFREAGIRHLVVTEEGEVRGILSVRDVVDPFAAAETPAEPAAATA